MFERHQVGERAVLVDLVMDIAPDNAGRGSVGRRQEFVELARSAGAEILSIIEGARQKPHPKLFVGRGKAEEIQAAVELHNADLVVFNHNLTPAQERNLERIVSCRVLDRSGLILAIFAQRARSFEGKLQVELAQLQHLSTRLVRGWTHLERQKGGIGLRGPGETQLETDRRLLSIRIKQINKRLAQVRRQREQNRSARRKAEKPTAVLVGYTNAGKSTLFNRLTAGRVYAADQLFATLDTTLRKLELPTGQSIILADTVGFVNDLPHELVSAFHATLLETRDADLLIHVVDVSNENPDDQILAVDRVLEQIGAKDVPRLLVANKIDETGTSEGVERNQHGEVLRVKVSALTGSGIDNLLDTLQTRLQRERIAGSLRLGLDTGAFRAGLYEENAIRSEQIESDGSVVLEVEMNRYRWHQLCKRHGIESTSLVEKSQQLARLA